MNINRENIIQTMTIGQNTYRYFDLYRAGVEKDQLERLPKTIKILLENALRNYDGKRITKEHIQQLTDWGKTEAKETGFIPSRIVLQDFTGVPAVVDLAAMREAVNRMGKDPRVINPDVQVDLVIDHSVMVDAYGNANALLYNAEREFERNGERYRFLKWAQQAFDNFRVIPPSTGIIHQVNLEYLASVVATKKIGSETYLYPDTLVGTDSHTTMINGIGVLGWGVGGIEAEAGMLSRPLYFVTPEVVGVKLLGHLKEGVVATDAALVITERLRKENVVGKFVEYFGEGVVSLSLPDRATIANMAPEYGATVGYFPIDEETLQYMSLTNRSDSEIKKIEIYLKAQGLFGSHSSDDVCYSKVVEIDLSSIEPSLSGPKRPQDRVLMKQMKGAFKEILRKPVEAGGYGKETLGDRENFGHGSLALAAITSCTNTSNPTVMIGAGLVAKKAVEAGLRVPDYVKTSLTPGSKVVTKYLNNAGLLHSLETLGFFVAGYGCATCIGNSGPLKDAVTKEIVDNDLVAVSVLSGNRNFEGRIHQHIKANYLASPMLVVAYAIAGRIHIDFETEPLGIQNGKEVYLKDIWPSNKEISEAVIKGVTKELFTQSYDEIFSKNKKWNSIEAPSGYLYHWDPQSTYIREPNFFEDLTPYKVKNIENCRVLLKLGDSITTDHISPAGSIGENSSAGKYLKEQGIEPKDYNSYGSRRGNHEVMMRGTFANIRIRNQLLDQIEGGFTKTDPLGEVQTVFEGAREYSKTKTPLMILAGKEYGTGSSRDWAAKGTLLLGIKAVLAESFERIHRSNLVGMGVLPLQFLDGENADFYKLTGYETFSFIFDESKLHPGDRVRVEAKDKDRLVSFEVILRLDSKAEIEDYLNRGILQSVLLDIKEN